MLPKVPSTPGTDNDPFALQVDAENRCYHRFDLNIKCSTEALKTFHRCSDAILERDPELFNMWIDDHRFYSHSIVEVIENELSSLHHKCLYSNLKPLQGFRWLEGLLLVIGSYSKYLGELNNNDRLDALLNLFFSAWITFFIHNRYAILQLSCPVPIPDANNNQPSATVDEHDKKVHVNAPKTDEQIKRHLDKHLPNFDRILREVIELGHQLSSKRLPNLDKFEELYRLWKDPASSRKRKSSGDFSLIIKRISSSVDMALKADDLSVPSSKSINWQIVFFDEFLRYADRFYLPRKLSSTSKRRTIGGERFCLGKWSTNKVHYFLTKNLFQRSTDDDYEKQIDQLYQ